MPCHVMPTKVIMHVHGTDYLRFSSAKYRPSAKMELSLDGSLLSFWVFSTKTEPLLSHGQLSMIIIKARAIAP